MFRVEEVSYSYEKCVNVSSGYEEDIGLYYGDIDIELLSWRGVWGYEQWCQELCEVHVHIEWGMLEVSFGCEGW